MTRIGIVTCDHFPEATRRVAGGELGDLYRRLLHGADPTLEFREYDATAGELPVGLDECDAWILTGSRADAHGDDGWVVALRDWIRQAADHRARIVGVCFGHQAVAQALGGRVARDRSWTVGPQTLTVDPTPWFDTTTVALNAMHRDVVTALPADGHPIGTGTTGEVPAFVVGDHILCVQDHPEYDDAITGFLIDDRRALLGDGVADDGLARVRTVPTDGAVVARWFVDFLLDRRR